MSILESKDEGVRLYTSLPKPVSQIFPILLEKNLITKELKRPNPEKFPNYDLSRSCDYHSGEIGHSIDDCIILKDKIQDLLDIGTFTFRNAWLCNGRDDLLVVPNIRTMSPGFTRMIHEGREVTVRTMSHRFTRMIHEGREVTDTLGQPSSKFDYYVKYSAPPSFHINPREIVPDGWGGMDDLTPTKIEDPDDALEGIASLFNNLHIGAIEGPSDEMGANPQE